MITRRCFATASRDEFGRSEARPGMDLPGAGEALAAGPRAGAFVYDAEGWYGPARQVAGEVCIVPGDDKRDRLTGTVARGAFEADIAEAVGLLYLRRREPCDPRSGRERHDVEVGRGEDGIEG